MLKNKKVLLALAVPVLLFAGYTMTKPKPVVHMKVKGTIYELPKEFLLNLSDGRYAKVMVALELAPTTRRAPKPRWERSRRNRSFAKSSPTSSPAQVVKTSRATRDVVQSGRKSCRRSRRRPM
jgi:hypothetical protein